MPGSIRCASEDPVADIMLQCMLHGWVGWVGAAGLHGLTAGNSSKSIDAATCDCGEKLLPILLEGEW